MISALTALATVRAAMVAADFNFASCGAVTALPASLTALNATYTRASAKNVPQGTSLVALASGQFGTSLDPSTGVYSYNAEPAATNLATYSDGTVAQLGGNGNVSNSVGGIAGFTNSIVFGDNALVRYAYKSVSITSGTTYSISVFVKMDDGSVPSVGLTNAIGDFSLVADSNVTSVAALVAHIGDNVYRVSSNVVAGTTATRYFGVIKYTGQSSKPFKITGFQVETGTVATSPITTTGSTATRAADFLVVPLWKNNIKDSQDGSTANWTRTNCTVATSGTSPNGAAQIVTATATAATSFYTNSILSPCSTNTILIWVKQGNQATCKVLVRNVTNATDFTTGTLTYATGVITGSGWTATNVGDGWFKCAYNTATNGDNATVGHSLRVYVGFNSTTYTAGDNFYFGGAQLQPGTTATTYIPTTSTLDVTGNANIPGFSSAGYTLFMDLRMPVAISDGVARKAIEVGDGTAANFCKITHYNNRIYAEAASASVAQSATIIKSPYGVVRHKAAVSTTTNSQLSAVDGVAATADTSLTMPAVLTLLAIGSSSAGASPINGYLYRAQLIPRTLTQAQLNGLTQ